MAAVAAGRPSRRKSRRVASACAFLSNISLDGNIAKDAVNGLKTEKNVTKRSHEKVEGNPDSLLSPRRALLHPIKLTEPSTSEGDERNSSVKNVKSTLHRQRSVIEAVTERRQQERTVIVRRSVSMSGSFESSSSTSESINRGGGKHRISCLTGHSFHHKRRATDKR